MYKLLQLRKVGFNIIKAALSFTACGKCLQRKELLGYLLLHRSPRS